MKRSLCLAALVVLFSFGALASEKNEQFEKWMKEVGGNTGKIKKGIEARAAEDVAKSAERLAVVFAESESFWAKHKKDDAVKWSKEAAAAAKEVAIAAKANDLDKAKTVFGGYMKSCKGCHEAYREKVGDGDYKIKL